MAMAIAKAIHKDIYLYIFKFFSFLLIFAFYFLNYLWRRTPPPKMWAATHQSQRRREPTSARRRRQCRWASSTLSCPSQSSSAGEGFRWPASGRWSEWKCLRRRRSAAGIACRPRRCRSCRPTPNRRRGPGPFLFFQCVSFPAVLVWDTPEVR